MHKKYHNLPPDIKPKSWSVSFYQTFLDFPFSNPDFIPKNIGIPHSIAYN